MGNKEDVSVKPSENVADKWEKVEKMSEDESHQKTQTNDTVEAIETPSHEELIAKINELEVNQEKMVRLLAEKENLIRRNYTELEKNNKYAVSKLSQELLSVLDSLELSLQAAPKDNDVLKSFYDGIDMTFKMLLGILEKQGIQLVNPLNQKFDPNFHEAISMQPSNEVPDGHILKVLQKGYVLHDRLIRPAMVIIAKAS
ncbi:MAG: Protein GrpE [Legionellaceae bacterium]